MCELTQGTWRSGIGIPIEQWARTWSGDRSPS